MFQQICRHVSGIGSKPARSGIAWAYNATPRLSKLTTVLLATSSHAVEPRCGEPAHTMLLLKETLSCLPRWKRTQRLQAYQTASLLETASKRSV